MGTSVFTKYPSDCKFGGMRVLNVGCGHAKFSAKNVVNVDLETIAEPDVQWDLSKAPYPFQDETFDLVIANHILEHVPNWWVAFEECSRVLKTGGVFEIWLPGDGTSSQLGYRDHINVINECSFMGIHAFYRNPGNAWATANGNGISTRMKAIRKDRMMNEKLWWIRWAPDSLKHWMAEHLRNVIVEDGFKFRKLPPEPIGNTERDEKVKKLTLFAGASK